jgi:hypothetical protein
VLEAYRRAHERRGIPFNDPSVGGGNDDGSYQDNNLAAQFIESVLDQRGVGRRMSAVMTGLHCSRLRPTDAHYHKALAYALMPERMVHWIRNRRNH